MTILRRFNNAAVAVVIFISLFSSGNGTVYPSAYHVGGQLELLRAIHDSNPLWEGSDPDFGKELVEQVAFPGYIKQFLNVLRNQSLETISKSLFDGRVNADCQGHVMEWLLRAISSGANLLSEEDKWVLQIVDSWGKLPEGVLSGHINAFGDFDECVELKARNVNKIQKNIPSSFEGRYCNSFLVPYAAVEWAVIKLPQRNQTREASISTEGSGISGVSGKSAVSVEEFFKIFLNSQATMGAMMPSMGVCMPNSCSQTEIQIVITNALNFTHYIMLQDPTTKIYPLAVVCAEEDHPPLKTDDIVVIVMLSTIFVVCLLAGVIDFFASRADDGPKKRGLPYQYLMAFSIYTNTKKWMSTRKGSEDMGCIHGIRFFSTAWVVLGHTYAASILVPWGNMIDVKKIHEDVSIMPILNGTFSVDTFFVMSGMLATYGILKTLDKTKGKLNIIMFYIHRYLRLTPTYAILVAIMATIVVYVGRGPYWNLIMQMQADTCKDKWWTNLLYINNIYMGMAELCHGETWYISNDMQFYVLSPFIVYPLWRWQKAGLFLLTFYTVASCIVPALLVEYRDAPPAALMTRPLSKGFTEIYMRPWARIQTYFVGMWLGWIIHKTRGKSIKIAPFLVAAGWLASTATALAVIFSIHKWFDPFYEIPKWSGIFYAAFSRFAWALVVAWIIFACLKGYGGIINRFLSWSPFMPLGRLTFVVYLSSYYLQLIFHTRQTSPLKYNTYNMINLFFSHMVMSFLVGFLLTMLFESPFIVLQKLLFEGGARAPTTQPQLRQKKGNAQPRSKRHGIFYENTDEILSGRRGQEPVAITMEENEKAD